MPLVTITRGDKEIVMPRGDVAQGMVFSVKGRNGRLGKQYAAVGVNGRAYSVNLATHELASSTNMAGKRVIIGKWKFQVTKHGRYGATRNCTRAQVRPGEVFKVEGGTDEYAHLGRISRDRRGWLSIPLARPENHAVTSNGDSHVKVVGTFQIAATLNK